MFLFVRVFYYFDFELNESDSLQIGFIEIRFLLPDFFSFQFQF